LPNYKASTATILNLKKINAKNGLESHSRTMNIQGLKMGEQDVKAIIYGGSLSILT